MKILLSTILICQFLIIIAQDTTELIKLKQMPIKNITIEEAKPIKKNNERAVLIQELAEDSLCQEFFNLYDYNCSENECLLEEAECKANLLNAENENSGFIYKVEFDFVNYYYFEECSKYFALKPFVWFCNISDVRVVRYEKSRIILDGACSGEIFYDEDIKRMPR
jgi:hypothetical protein